MQSPRQTYLDYNATAPLKPAVKAAMAESLDVLGNPSSVHTDGRYIRSMIETAREKVAQRIDCKPSEIIFTSGGTEANALALGTVGCSLRYCSSIEHEAVLSHVGASNRIATGSLGTIDLEALEAGLSEARPSSLVSVMAANNETGVIQPIEEVRQIAHKHGVLFHCDAVQGFGKIELSFRKSGADFMSISAHKIGGPAGTGALIVRSGITVKPLQSGGGQERGRRPGTENIVGIVGFGAAAEAGDPGLYQAHTRPLQDRLETALAAKGVPMQIFGQGVDRLSNTTCIGLANVKNETQLMTLDLAGISVSAGSACSSGKVTPSHVLTAMGFNEKEAKSAIRISYGWATTSDDIDLCVLEWGKMASRLSDAKSVA